MVCQQEGISQISVFPGHTKMITDTFSSTSDENVVVQRRVHQHARAHVNQNTVQENHHLQY